MDEQPRKSAVVSTPFLVVATVLVLGLFVAFAPVVDCPRCTTWNFFGPFEDWQVNDLKKPCRVCGGRRKASLLKDWTYRPAEKNR